jgi:hypothetical protein
MYLWTNWSESMLSEDMRGTLPKDSLIMRSMRLSPLSMVHHQPMVWGSEWDTVDGWEGEAGNSCVAQATVDLCRFIFSTFVMMEQRIAVTTRQEPDRAARKRRRKWNQDALDNLVETVVVHLRRRESSHHESDEEREKKDVEWTHRWMVDGHWRRIHQGTDNERAIWISPHIKGPEELPLVIKDRVYHFDH